MSENMNLMPIYSVPLWQSEYPDFKEHKELFLSAVKKYKKENPPVGNSKSNVFGYQSPETLHHVEEFMPLFEYICQMAHKAVSDLNFIECDVAITSAWVNVNDTRQCMNAEHVHGQVFAGVFYLSVPKESGKLCIMNPGLNRLWKGSQLTDQKNQFTAEQIKIEPEEGNVIIFPSYIPHSVETNNHDEERISISFNIIALQRGAFPREVMMQMTDAETTVEEGASWNG